MKRVVGDQPTPDQVPQRLDGLGREAAADGVVERREERRAMGAEVVDDCGLAIRWVRR